ncbi:MAG TPA: acyltransferase [Chitinophagales bacterium]|nr:acyltransferase [Chitinophagales bacterium]
MKEQKIYFENLDSIRFIAAMMVFLGHVMVKTYTFLPIKGTLLEDFLLAISSGGTGVSIFFVLSGFLITYLLITEYEVSNKIDLKKFYIRRILRIWPLYYGVVFFSFLLYPFLKSIVGMNNPLGSNFIYHLFFLSNFDVIHIQQFTPGKDAMSQNITWSVSVEEQFYLFWPLIFTFLPKKTWLLSILTVIAGSLMFRYTAPQTGADIYFHTFAVLIDLGIGGLFAYMIKKYATVRTFFENSSTKTHIVLFSVVIFLLVYGDELLEYKNALAFNRAIYSFSFGMVIAAQAITKSQSPLNLKNLSFANKWGKYTYGIYLLHPIAITVLDISLRVAHISIDSLLPSFLLSISTFILTLVISKLSYTYFESRFIKLKDKFTVVKSYH